MGGNGYIGRNIVKAFSAHNETADVYDLFPAGNDTHFYQGNVRDDEKLDEIISRYDSLIYLISSVSPKKSMDAPESAYVNDIPMLIKVLDSCVRSGCKRVIFASSGGTVYGEGEGRVLSEDSYCQPINHYAICKEASEKILLMYNQRYGMENVILRVSNPYGQGQNPKSGVGAITIFSRKALADEEITLYADPDTVRDYINVFDVAEAFYQAVYYDFDKDVIPVFNIGSGIGFSLKDIIAIIADTLNKEVCVQVVESRGYDVKYNVLDIEKAQKYLSYGKHEDEEDRIREYILKLKEENGWRK